MIGNFNRLNQPVPIGHLNQRSSSDQRNMSSFTLAKYRLASSPDTSRAILSKLASSNHAKIVARVAENPQTPAEVLAELARHEEAEVRTAVTENLNTPPHILKLLITDEHPDVRYSLAENHNLTLSLLTQLMQDDNPYIALRAKRTYERLMAIGNQKKDQSLRSAS